MTVMNSISLSSRSGLHTSFLRAWSSNVCPYHPAFPTGALTFTGTAGETQTITVAVSGDTVIEGNETLKATLGTVTTTGVVSRSEERRVGTGGGPVGEGGWGSGRERRQARRSGTR